MAEWVRASTGGRTVAGSSPTSVKTFLFGTSKNGNTVYPALPVSFGWDSNSRWSLLYGVYARGSKISHQSALECVSVVDSTSHSKPHTSSLTTLEISHYKTFVCYPVKMMCSKSNQIIWETSLKSVLPKNTAHLMDGTCHQWERCLTWPTANAEPTLLGGLLKISNICYDLHAWSRYHERFENIDGKSHRRKIVWLVVAINYRFTINRDGRRPMVRAIERCIQR